MRFLLFSAQYLPTPGGVERYTHNLALALAAGGHRVTIVTSALPGLPPREKGAANVEVFRLPARLFMGGRFPALRRGAAWNRAVNALFKTGYDFALINTRFYPLSLWAARQCAARGIPAAVLEHGTKHLSTDNPLLDVAANAYEHAAIKMVRRHCSRFYGVSKASSRWLLHFGISSCGELYNAVNPAALAAEAAGYAGDVRSRYGIAAGAPLVLFVGRLLREKGIWELMAAFEQLHGALPAARLLVAGGGPLADELRQKAPEGVVFAGEVAHNESLAALQTANVFCLPSYSEGFSTVILEAAALGTPIVTTPTGGSPELITNGENGILLADLRPATITEALEKALADKAWQARAARGALSVLNSKFTWARTAEKLVALAQNGVPPSPGAKAGAPPAPGGAAAPPLSPKDGSP